MHHLDRYNSPWLGVGRLLACSFVFFDDLLPTVQNEVEHLGSRLLIQGGSRYVPNIDTPNNEND
jgi:hypothetical protein